jgi:outer membrane protein TolC
MADYAKEIRVIVAIAAVVLAAGAGPIAAQTNPSSRLTLDQALQLAERSNPQYRQATNNLELNDIENREGWLSMLPQPQLRVLSSSMSWNLQRVGTDPFGNPLPNPEARLVQSSTSSQAAAMSLTFDFSRYLQFKHRGDNGDVRVAYAANQLQSLHGNVRRSYLNAQLQQLLVDLEAQNLERERQNQQVAQQLYALARRERIDLLEGDLAVAVQEDAVRQARVSLSTALLGLRSEIGDPDLDVDAVEPVPFRKFDPSGLDEDVLVRAALGSNIQLQQDRAQLAASDRQLDVVKAQQWLPILQLNANTGRSELERGGGGSFFQVNPSGGWDRNFSLNVSFPDLGRYFGVQNQTQRQRLTMRNTEERLRQGRLDVEQSVRAALVGLRSAYASVELQQKRLAIAEETLKERLDKYRLGNGTFQDLTNATESVAAAQRTLLLRRYDVERGLVELELALAMPLERIAELR